VIGAFGAHGLKKIVTDLEQLKSFETGVKYQMYAGLGMLVVGLSTSLSKINLKTFNTLLILGVILFSGSIYGLVLSKAFGVKMSFLGPITPLGGVLMIVGWIVLLRKVLIHKE